MTGEDEEQFFEAPPTPMAMANVTPPSTTAEPSDHHAINDASSGGGISDADTSTSNSRRPHWHVHFPPRAHININSSRGRISINASRPVGSSGNSRNNNGTNISYRQPSRTLPARSMLPPLEPQPLPDRTDVETNGSRGKDDEEDDKMKFKADMKKFECAICFEFMDYPVGCGSCQTRFCEECLQRVLRQSAGNESQSTDPPNSAKCPHCRSIFTLQSIVQDGKLRKEICDCIDTVTCPFRGCATELRIGLLKAHEASCPYMRMRCRYAEWGCNWVGQRKFIEDHDAHNCEFRGGLGKLVERYRQCDARTGHALHQHHIQIAATSQMLTLHSRQMMMVRNRNAGNIFDVLQLAYEASLFPGRFCAMREVWISLISQHDAQCLVCNIMLLTPSMMLIFKEGINGLKNLFGLFEKLSGDNLWLFVDTLLLSLISATLGVMCLSCFFIDSKSTHEWATYNIRNIILGPILRDIASVCMTMTYYCTITFSLHSGFILWQFTTIVTVLYTSFVSFIMAKSNNSPSTARAMRASRAWPVVIFGLRYGFLIATCGFSRSTNAVVTMRLLKNATALSPKATLDDSECFIHQISTVLLIAISGFVTAFDAADLDAISWPKIVLDWMFATAALAYANGIVFLLDEAGCALGGVNFNVGSRLFMQARQSSGAVLPSIKPTSVGCFVCGVCSFLLLFIAAA